MISLTQKQPIRFRVQHYMNSLHFYSFMRRLKISRERAIKTAKAYERVVHPLIYF